MVKLFYLCYIKVTKNKKNMENQIAIHENENSEKVVKYIAESEFNDEIISMLNNGNIYGLFFEGDTIVAVDIWQTKHYDIFK